MIRGKVVLVPFPFDDFSSLKVRPAVCLTNAIGEYGHVIAAFITSKVLADPLPSDVVIHENHHDFKLAGLKVPSTIRLHRVMTISLATVKRELGQLSSAFVEEVSGKFKTLF